MIYLTSDSGAPSLLERAHSYIKELFGQPPIAGPIRSGQTPSAHVKVGAGKVDCQDEDTFKHLLQPSTIFSYAGSDIHIPFSFFQHSKPSDTNNVQRIEQKLLRPVGHNVGVSIAGNFIQVRDQPLYFGEWSLTGELGEQSHMLYYSGDLSTSRLPEHTLTYNTQGLNNYDGENLLYGHLIASFGAEQPQLSGLIYNEDTIIKLDAFITPDGTFSGDATAYSISSQTRRNGITKGNLFGVDSNAAIAGIATFADSDYDSAFGGPVSLPVNATFSR
ncbi:hypothetical protein DVB73_06985 [Pseudomonas plecoglossicida]|uniref:Transferrin-binding protein B C-lobe/N-lobe beta barrel domain-containing protein n=2 Tax=Pseudomonas plecoglossicida TaxID=70775 RepID=A0AAD0VSY3_PSEDL|nr:hypothetical protein DVB73_06985 [Pseudomonas plecoglossicida]EPB94368.1 hypothetical protein L321_18522 [Pseudomonas plecoglossicida NB2011]